MLGLGEADRLHPQELMHSNLFAFAGRGTLSTSQSEGL